jgi:membrane-bound inhibitor of C-type lysozyme
MLLGEVKLGYHSTGETTHKRQNLPHILPLLDPCMTFLVHLRDAKALLMLERDTRTWNSSCKNTAISSRYINLGQRPIQEHVANQIVLRLFKVRSHSSSGGFSSGSYGVWQCRWERQTARSLASSAGQQYEGQV